MSLTLLIVFITAIIAGLGFWFYNRRQITSLTETIEDKNAIINSFRGHLAPTTEEATPNTPGRFNSENEPVIDLRPEKKKQRYGNRPKKTNSQEKNQKQRQQENNNSEKKNKPNKQRKPKTQQ